MFSYFRSASHCGDKLQGNISFATIPGAPTTGLGKSQSIILDSLLYPTSGLDSIWKIPPEFSHFTLYSFWETILHYTSADFTREDTGSFCPGLSLQGLCSKHPWKIVIMSTLKQRTCLFASQNNTDNIAKESEG